MTIRIGNASAPRWYDLSPHRLEEYIAQIVKWGASSTELVLHCGEADERTRRVHILEEDWITVFEQYRARGVNCHAHAPLHPRFKLDRWRDDPDGLKVDLLPVLQAAATFSQRQNSPCVVVLHCASGLGAEETTAQFLDWASREIQLQSDLTLSLELRSPRPGVAQAFDRERSTIAAFVDWFGNERVGICWDIAHDWESREINPDWTVQVGEAFTKHVNHVHLHDVSGERNLAHFPLQAGRIPWRSMLAPLIERGYSGAITMEIRYRLALAMGDPWTVLGSSYSLLSSFLQEEIARAAHSDSVAATP